MSLTIDPTLRGLNDCGCCEGLAAATPVKVENWPGLSAIAYRVGVHTQFKDAMLARLSASHYPALHDLTTRDNDDFSITLLDAWATVGDVLTFYQERIANESFLRTATERRSVLELARLIGYKLSLGVAAGTYLAFMLEDVPGTLGYATIDIGAKVQSIPGPNEKPQTFETIEKIEARAEWNTIKPRLTQPQQLSTDMERVIVQGTATNLKPGDKLLIVVGKQKTDRKVRRVRRVVPDAETQTTCIELEKTLEVMLRSVQPALFQGSVYKGQVNLTSTLIRTEILGKTWKSDDLFALATIQDWSMEDLVSGIAKLRSKIVAPAGTGVFAFRKRACLFGYNAPEQFDPVTMTWNEWSPENESGDRLFLDNAYEEVVPESYIAIRKPYSSTQIFTISQVKTHPRTEYGMSAKTTEITLAGGETWWNPPPLDDDGFDVIRGTTIDIQSEPLDLAEIAIPDRVAEDSVELDNYYPYLQAGQRIILTGEPADQPGVVKSETMTLAEATMEGGFSVLTFTQSLTHRYIRKTVTINANVARATHGETVQEVLGSGDASQPYQRFTLRQPPLTHVSADTPSGAESTLQVRVNDLLWREVSTLYGCGPNDRVFVTRTDDDGKTTLQFGDGVTGARLPTGQDNVRAVYRKGIGLEGLVRAEQLSLLMTRPLGVKDATNPLAADGADDPESLDEARQNAPLTILTLDRTVSLKDYEDFARSFAGIAKALATWTWDGQARSVFITVARPNGAEISSDSKLYNNLPAALAKAGDPCVKLRVKSYRKALFRIAGSVNVAQDHLPDKVLAAVEQSLRKQFSFDARTFGQPVTLSEVIAVMQAAPGVVAVDLDKFYRVAGTKAVRHLLPVSKFYRAYKTKVLAHRLLAAMPVAGANGKVAPAELLTLDPGPLELWTM